MTHRKIFICIAGLLAAAGLLSGCYNEAMGDTKKEETVLKWICGGVGEQRDSEKVWKKFNEELQKYLPDTKVEFECISTKNYGEKWKLMSTSQQEMDIVWCSWQSDFVSEVKKGSYMPLDNLIKEYAPSIKEKIPAEMLKKQTVEGRLYSIPCMQQMVSYVSTLNFDYDLYEKYKDYINPDELSAFFASHDKMDSECWDKIEQYIKLFADNGDLYNGVIGFESHAEKGYEWVRNPYKIEDYGDDYTVVNYYRTPEYKLFIERYSDWYKKGYIRKDFANIDRNTGFYPISGEGNYLIGQGCVPSEKEIEAKRKSGERLNVRVPFYDEHYIPYGAAASSIAISSSCKNPEKAIKLLELMNTEKGKELYNILVYGIEGEHYEKVTNNKVRPVGYTKQPAANTPYGQYAWALGNSFNAYQIYSEWDDPSLDSDFIKKLNGDARESKLIGFSLDTTPIKLELKQIDAVVEEYGDMKQMIISENCAEMYDEFVEKLKLAGDDKVVAEIQRQIDEWRNKN